MSGDPAGSREPGEPFGQPERLHKAIWTARETRESLERKPVLEEFTPYPGVWGYLI